MVAVNYSTIRNNLKDYCDKASDQHETIIVTRKNEKNIVLMSLDEYNRLEKAARYSLFLAMIPFKGFNEIIARNNEYLAMISLNPLNGMSGNDCMSSFRTPPSGL